MPIIFGKNVKKPGATHNWSDNPEDIKELEKCYNDFYYFCKYVKVVHPDLGKVIYEPRWYQKEIIDSILNNRYFIGLLSRQVGKTISVSVYILWYAMFHDNKMVGIVSNKEKSAKKILKTIKTMYEDLPMFLKPGV